MKEKISYDIFKDSILNVVKKYVNDNVHVIVYETDKFEYFKSYNFSTYTLQLKYKNCISEYCLHNDYVKHEGYIMRVVSDLCNDISRMTGKERNYFFKRSDT